MSRIQTFLLFGKQELRIFYVAMSRAKLGLSLTRILHEKRNSPETWSDKVRCLVDRIGKGISTPWEITKPIIQEFQLTIPRALTVNKDDGE